MVHTNKKQGFTVIELSIAAIVLALLMGVSYKIFSGASLGFQRSTKSLTMQNEMRNGLNFIREEMQRASYKSKIRINGNIIYDAYKFSLCKDSEINGNSSGKALAKWFICKPFTKDSGVVFECTLKVVDNKILYTKVVNEGSDSSEPLFQNKVVISQIGKIRLSTEDITSGTGSEVIGALINIETFAVDSTKGQADLNVSAQTGAKVEVKVVKEL